MSTPLPAAAAAAPPPIFSVREQAFRIAAFCAIPSLEQDLLDSVRCRRAIADAENDLIGRCDEDGQDFAPRYYRTLAVVCARSLDLPEIDARAGVEWRMQAFLLTTGKSAGRSDDCDGLSTPEVARAFARLVVIWRAETGEAPLGVRFAHPAYWAIMALRTRAVPLILRELQWRPDRWFHALRTITGEDAAPDADTFEQIRARWLLWGRAKNLV